MTWRVFVRADAETDFDGLDDADQQRVADELFAWVDQGPPRHTRREVFGVEMFDDDLSGGFRVTYVVDDDQQNVLVMRIRKVAPPA